MVIFGAGLLGKYALKFLLARNFRIVAFCDNCTEKQTDITEKLPVLDLSKCKKCTMKRYTLSQIKIIREKFIYSS